MHPSAMSNAKLFFDTYVGDLGEVTVVDVGSQDVNGSLREVCPPAAKYIGVDFAEAKGVDVVLTDPYHLPFADSSVDVVVSSSCFEHSEMFWLVFNEILRILKPTGLFYMNAPSNGYIHRYPVDCWRFYPDAGNALVAWGKRNGFNPVMLECYTSKQTEGFWNDYVAIFLKDETCATKYPARVTSHFSQFMNGMTLHSFDFINPSELPEDMERLEHLQTTISNYAKILSQSKKSIGQRILKEFQRNLKKTLALLGQH